MEEEYLTAKQTAERLDISPSGLEHMRLNLDGPAYIVVDRKICYKLIDINAFEEIDNHMKSIVRADM